MNVDELREVLDADAEPVRHGVVLAAVAARRRSRRRRQWAVGACAAAVLAVGATTAGWQPWTGGGSHHTVARPGPIADGCGPLALSDVLAAARSDGGSVIEGYGRLTSTTTNDAGAPYRQMALTDVRTLAGAPVSAVSTGWLLAVPQTGGRAGGGAPGVWAPDGHLVAIVEPASVAGTSVGPVLRVAPVVGSDVILSSAGCWTSAGLSTQPYAGPLAEVPGTGAVAAARATGGFHAFPVAAFAALATH